MTFPEFNDYQQKLLEQVVAMKDTKGREYANSESRFANFDRLAVQLNLTNIQVAWVYLAKHLDSIVSYCKNGETYSTETIQSRIVDAITYLTLIGGMITENERQLKNVRDRDYKIDVLLYHCIGCHKGYAGRDMMFGKITLCRDCSVTKDLEEFERTRIEGALDDTTK